MKDITKQKITGKKVLVRVCFDVPLKGNKVVNDSRIRDAVPTIEYLTNNGAAVILVSKLGRPNGKKVRAFSLGHVVKTLEQILNRKVKFSPEAIGPKAEKAVAELKPGEVLLLENLRFYKGEEENDPKFAEKLSSYADLFVMDDFPNIKNNHAGITGVAKLLPAFAGISFKEEVEALTKAFEKPKKPFVAVIGGAKISTKIDVLKALIKKVDVLIVGGGMANTFLVAEGYDIGKSLYEEDYVDSADEIIREAGDCGVEVILPDDVVVAKKVKEKAKTREVAIDEVEKGDIIVDVGPKSVGKFAEPLKFAGTIFWNGPMGIAEYANFANGNIGVAKIIAESKAKSVVGGGDTIASVKDLNLPFDFVSSGGGATLEFLAGEKLPGLEALGK